MPTKVPPSPNQPSPQSTPRARTILASLLGILAVVLILSSFVTVWLNRSLTNTKTFVGLVGPLASQPDIQKFVADKAGQAVVDSTPSLKQAQEDYQADPTASNGLNAQAAQSVQNVADSAALKIITSPGFAKLWTSTIQKSHAELISQLNSNSDTLTLDLSPVISGVVSQINVPDSTGGLSTNAIALNGGQVAISPDQGKLSFQSTSIQKVHQDYQRFMQYTVAIVVATIILVVLAVVISVDHIKTARRILLGTGILLLLFALSLQIPAVVAARIDDQTTQKAVVAVTQTLLGNLQKVSLWSGIGCIVLAIGSKIFQVVWTKQNKGKGPKLPNPIASIKRSVKSS